ncbi:V-type ATP synthase subunit D [Chlamydiifrater phoenicopteri]|uniref:V-type ATP synthase subunit D n=1 Tax=Chlamydiifrater phoenicopteri TaxID=2681469 RepID=UPI001BD03DA7|nr:V-type ATP synthase subunit D [Chlamydiifrater phoenicopteri]
MAAPLKLTKNEFRARKSKLEWLQAYLPTLKLKKALLQSEVQAALSENELCEREYESTKHQVYAMAELFSIPIYIRDVEESFQVSRIDKELENIAGVEVPVFRGVEMKNSSYSLLDTPAWTDTLIALSRDFVVAKIKSAIAKERCEILQAELRNVSIRVNLFEKKLIPETKEAMKKITIFLNDRAMVDVGQNKIAKKKIEEKKEAFHEG